MEPIPYFFDTVNRSGIGVKPKRPLLDWINALYPDMIEDGSESTVYLVKERCGAEEIENWLKRNFKNIFESELNDRHTDEANWPQKRTFKVFKAWFDTEAHPMVMDVEESPLLKT